MNKLTHAEGPQQALTNDVLEKLGSRKETQRAQAEAVVGGLGAFAPDALMAVLRKEGEQRRRRRKWVWVALAAFVVLMVVLASVGMAHNIGVFGGMFSAMCAWAAVSAVQKNAARKLAEFDDIRSTGFLLEALEYDDGQLREIAAAKLTVLLPRLKASDAVLLTEEQRACLNRQTGKVRIDREAPLLLAMLKALEQVGDERSVPAVRALANRPGNGEVAARVRAAAREALPAVEQSAERWRNATTLLRPASGAAADRAEERLLRPSASDT
ncbi:MAG TPA: hypothetical protein VLH79_11080 [Chthonomonadales bacterium]|nr:hypothetical protein [Chthonomonadales bacterium]